MHVSARGSYFENCLYLDFTCLIAGKIAFIGKREPLKIESKEPTLKKKKIVIQPQIYMNAHIFIF